MSEKPIQVSKAYRKNTNTYAMYECPLCGEDWETTVHSVKSGKSKSCGCQKITHGKTGIRIYRIWTNMLTRCTNESSDNWSYYGGRGIKVDEDWYCFENFYKDMGDCPEGMSLERIDVNGDYCSENCKWIPIEEQPRNRIDTVYLTDKGVTKSLHEWSKISGTSYEIIRLRHKRGWPDHEAIYGRGN